MRMLKYSERKDNDISINIRIGLIKRGTMLFHITATHAADNCPGYNLELMPAVVEAIESSNELAEQLGIKIHFLVNAAPQHVVFALVEADDSSRIPLWTSSFPIKQDFDVTPVTREEELAAMAKEMMARKSS